MAILLNLVKKHDQWSAWRRIPRSDLSRSDGVALVEMIRCACQLTDSVAFCAELLLQFKIFHNIVQVIHVSHLQAYIVVATIKLSRITPLFK